MLELIVLNIMNKKECSIQSGFSLVEVIIAALLFSATAAGVFSTISYTNRRTESDLKIKAALFSKKVLDGLNKDVSESSWAVVFATGPHPTVITYADYTGCSATYTVSDVDGARKVNVNSICN